MSDVWSDASFLKAACDIELAWVKAAAEFGFAPTFVVPELQARISEILTAPLDLMPETRRIGRPIAPLVDALAKGTSQELQKVLHLGLTTQDILDGAFVLLRGEAARVCDTPLNAMVERLCTLSETHAQTVMPARSNGQIAGVTTFGLCLAEFAAELSRGRDRIKTRQNVTNTLILSGPVGLSNQFGEKTQAIRHHAAKLLNLKHDTTLPGAARDNIADLHLSLGLLAKSLGRIAQTVMTLQSEGISELSETDPGASSSIPQKANPRLAEEVIALTARVDGQLLEALTATQTRHHRSGETWRQEWAASAGIFTTLYASLQSSLTMISRLKVNSEMMARNIASIGLRAFADRLLVDLSSQVGRTDAKRLLSEVDLAALTLEDAAQQHRAPQSRIWNVEPSSDIMSLSAIQELAEQKRAAIVLETCNPQFISSSS